MSKITVNGRAFWQALAYAFEICPSGDSSQRLAHVVIIDRRIICADGTRWHVGMLPEDVAVERPMVIARESVRELLIRLEFADKIARIHGGGFFVHLSGYNVTLQYGSDEEESHQKLIDVNVGHIPESWTEPVSSSAPEIPSSELHCGHVIDAAKWWQSWEKDHGRITPRGQGPGKPVRFDITNKGNLVGVAFILPPTATAAQLPPDEPLFVGTTEELRGQSILDLSLELPPLPASPARASSPKATKAKAPRAIEGPPMSVKGKRARKKAGAQAPLLDDAQ